MTRTSDWSAAGPSARVLGPAGGGLAAGGQVLAGWNHAAGFLISALGLLMLASWAWSMPVARRQTVVAGIGFFTAALTPISASWFAVLIVGRWTEKGRSRSRVHVITTIGAGLLLGALSAAAIALWWRTRTGIVFYDALPTDLIAESPVAVVVGGCAVAAISNAVWEETLWRQVLMIPFSNYKAAIRTCSVAALSVSFGLAHLHSAPGGWIGVVLTTAFALAAHAACLFLRGGIVAAIIGHSLADFTLLLLLALGG